MGAHIDDEDLEKAERSAAESYKFEALEILAKLVELRASTLQDCRSCIEMIYWQEQLNGMDLDPELFQLHEEIELIERNLTEAFGLKATDLAKARVTHNPAEKKRFNRIF
jgi:hypothetical protein